MNGHSTFAPLVIGAFMGFAMPWMVHSMGADLAGLWFLLAHFAVLLPLGLLALRLPRVRAAIAHHMRGQHLKRMAAGVAGGWAATCAMCLAIGGVHWT